VVRSEGIRALYKGWVPFLLNVTYGVAQFATYAYIKNEIFGIKEGKRTLVS